MAMARKNSFHLMLSDDELALLHMLAEREGLNASDYLRTMLRRLAGTAPHLAEMMRLGELMRSDATLARILDDYRAPAKAKPKPKKAR
jgi:hypothetical protein